MEKSAIISSKMVSPTVTIFEQSVMEYIKESTQVAWVTVLDLLSIIITMSMTVNGSLLGNTEKECSRKHKLEELKEDFMKMIKSKKFLK